METQIKPSFFTRIVEKGRNRIKRAVEAYKEAQQLGDEIKMANAAGDADLAKIADAYYMVRRRKHSTSINSIARKRPFIGTVNTQGIGNGETLQRTEDSTGEREL